MKTFKKILWVLIVVVLVSLLFKHWSKTDAATMNTSYCYQESADGSLYHYVCSE